jgi:alpha-L-rhamnosidase
MNSFNHYSLGSVGEWLYRFLLGIDQEPGTAGFGQLLLRPHPGGSLDWARGSYQSVRGRIRSGWRRDQDRLTYWAELPPNVTATVRIASDQPAEVRDAAGNPPRRSPASPGPGMPRKPSSRSARGRTSSRAPPLTALRRTDLRKRNGRQSVSRYPRLLVD